MEGTANFSITCEWYDSCYVSARAMLNIQRSSSEGVVLSLSGRIEIEDVAELQRLMGQEPADQALALDLQNVTLIDRDAVSFLACCEREGVKLDHCPAYIREWMAAQKGGSRNH